MVKVCEDADRDDVHVKQEIQELQDLNRLHPNTQIEGATNVNVSATHVTGHGAVSSSRLSPLQSAVIQHSEPIDAQVSDRGLRMKDIPLYDKSKDHSISTEKSAEKLIKSQVVHWMD